MREVKIADFFGAIRICDLSVSKTYQFHDESERINTDLNQNQQNVCGYAEDIR